MKPTNYEDLIMKRAMDLFPEEGLKFFGINKKVKKLGSTELVVLETKICLWTIGVKGNSFLFYSNE